MKYAALFWIGSCFCFLCCSPNQEPKKALPEPPKALEKGSFGYDLEFLKKYYPDMVLLSDDRKMAQVIIVPDLQGRVMTSTTSGVDGMSFGWVNHELMASGKKSEHFHAFGGEERFWIGPEGGQFSVFFKAKTPFTYENWFVPKALDTEPFRLIKADKQEAHFEKNFKMQNYSGTDFTFSVHRTIRLLDIDKIQESLGVEMPDDVEYVGFESENIMTNTGYKVWEKETGLLSIWILSMLNASDSTAVAIPYRQGDEEELGKIATDDYFGIVPEGRLKASGGLILFKADAKLRSKIGISPQRALPIAASWDSEAGMLTIAQFTLPTGVRDYVNSKWVQQKEPFAGDAVNAYNDGPNEGEKQLGSFYELESSSPAAALKPGESLTHWHRTIHLKGTPEDLNPIVLKLLGMPIDSIRL